MITEIAEHSVDLDLLPKNARILDAGCRGFGFTDAMQKLDHIVYPVDCDDLKTVRNYHQLAIGGSNGTAGVVKTNDPQARHITEGTDVEKITISSFAKRMGLKKFDLIKLDVEGEESRILWQANTWNEHPLAAQISVEFHAHCGYQTKTQLDDLLDWLDQWYTIHNRVWESRHGAGFNYWDILLIAK